MYDDALEIYFARSTFEREIVKYTELPTAFYGTYVKTIIRIVPAFLAREIAIIDEFINTNDPVGMVSIVSHGTYIPSIPKEVLMLQLIEAFSQSRVESFYFRHFCIGLVTSFSDSPVDDFETFRLILAQQLDLCTPIEKLLYL